MRKWQPVDIIVMILTIGIFVVLVAPMLVRFFNPEISISKGGLGALIQISIALISIVSMYIGAKVNGKGKS